MDHRDQDATIDDRAESSWCDWLSGRLNESIATIPDDQDETPAVILGTEDLEEVLNVFECFNLLERVWPSDTVDPIQIDGYLLLTKIGEGGMGVVWEAQQQQPICRKVAIKLIRHGLFSSEAFTRFEKERSILAILDHPHIAKIFDAGTTDDGQLYYAMELVDGSDLTSYCDNNLLPVADRLTLFLDICSAIQHAHQKGIIHRDLKPSNILVKQLADSATPTVIDFGLAKALDEISNDSSDHQKTKLGQLVGTLKYMSPEQANLSSTNVDTRTDVYALGIILYELLTGVTPFQTMLSSDDSILKKLTAIREQTPQRPSHYFKNNDQEEIAERRSTNPGSLRRILSGDLDWIVMQAIEKQPADRYSSVSELATDIRRYLNNDPVSARPPSTGYQLAKLLRKHRVIASALFAVAAALFLGTAAATWGWWQANQANHQANVSLQHSRNSNEILANIFDDLNAFMSEQDQLPIETRLAENLTRAADQLQSETVGDRNESAQLLLRLGNALRSVGHSAKAIPLLEEAYEVLKNEQGFDALTFQAGRGLAESYNEVGNVRKALETLEPLADDSRKHLGPKHAETAMILQRLAYLNYQRGNASEAIPLFREAIQCWDQSETKNHIARHIAEHGLGMSYVKQQDLNRAFPILEGSLSYAREHLKPENPRVTRVLLDLASTYSRVGNHAAALPLANEAYELSLKNLGADNTRTHLALQELGKILQAKGDLDAAIMQLEKAVAGLSESAGKGHPTTMHTRNLLADIYGDLAQYKMAVSLLESNIAERGTGLPDNHPVVIRAICALAANYSQLGLFDRAQSLLNTELNSLDSQMRNQAAVVRCMLLDQLGFSLFLQQDYVQSIQTHRQAVDGFEQMRGKLHPETLRAIGNLSRAMSYGGEAESAVQLLGERLEQVMNGGKRNLRAVQSLTVNMGIALRLAGRNREAIEHLERISQSGFRLKHEAKFNQELRLAYVAENQIEKLTDSIRQESTSIRRRFADDGIVWRSKLKSLSLQLVELEIWEEAQDNLEILVANVAKDRVEPWEYWLLRFLHQVSLLAQDKLESTTEMEFYFEQIANDADGSTSPAELVQLSQYASKTAELLERKDEIVHLRAFQDRLMEFGRQNNSGF